MHSAALRLTSGVSIPLREVKVSFVRSSGPGGQNVNKVASKAVARFNLVQSASIPPTMRERAIQRLRTRLTKGGTLVLTCSTYRDQTRNRDAVLARLRAILAAAVRPPKARIATRPTTADRERRLRTKLKRGRLKEQRGWKPTEDLA